MLRLRVLKLRLLQTRHVSEEKRTNAALLAYALTLWVNSSVQNNECATSKLARLVVKLPASGAFSGMGLLAENPLSDAQESSIPAG